MGARFSSLFARRPPSARPPAAPQPEAAPEGDSSQPLERVPPPGRLRRERRLLVRRREQRIRDVGGLALEMYRHDRFKPDLLLERCADVIAVEERIHEIDSLLTAAGAAPRGLRGITRCQCGAPLPRGAHFCSHCGRPATETPAVLVCSHCGQPLPADTNFCPACGNSAVTDEFRPDEGYGPDESEPGAPLAESSDGR